jgi:hypothetical protein
MRRIRGRAVKALRSGRSQLCWRGFESHRMQHLFLSCLGLRCSPRAETSSFKLPLLTHAACGRSSYADAACSEPMGLPVRLGRFRFPPWVGFRQQQTPPKKTDGGTGIRARVKRITTVYANHYTIPPWLGREADLNERQRSERDTRREKKRGSKRISESTSLAATLLIQLFDRGDCGWPKYNCFDSSVGRALD